MRLGIKGKAKTGKVLNANEIYLYNVETGEKLELVKTVDLSFIEAGEPITAVLEVYLSEVDLEGVGVERFEEIKK